MCLCKEKRGSFPSEVGVLVHPPLGRSVKFVRVSVNGGSALHSAGFTSPKTKQHGFFPVTD